MIADISGWIARWGSWTPAKTALRFEGRSVSYSQLEQDVGLVAGWLRHVGVMPGDRVAYLGPNCPELLELLFACARLGAIFVPLNNRMPPPELRVFVQATRPRVLIAEQDLGRVALDSAAHLGRSRVRTFEVGCELARRVTTAERVPTGAGIDPAAPVLILFTSGTTGRPKGATFTNENLAFHALNAISAFGLTAEDEILTAVPMFHSGGLFIHTTPALCAGATITIHRQFAPGRLLEEIERQRITLLAGPPTMTFALAADPSWEQANLTSLRCVYTGSTTVPRSAIEPWQQKGVSVAQAYGSTEATPVATTMPPGSPPETAFIAGKPTLYTHMRIVDQAGHDVAIDEPGEVWFRGPAVMQGYWDNEQATRDAFSDGWLRTGDLGLTDEDGYLHIVGRLKDIVIVAGSNVYPSDLEAILDDCTEIREAAVTGRPDLELGEVPVAFVVLTPGSTLGSADVLGLFEHKLAAYKHPREVFFLNQLPRNWHGKIDRPRLRELATREAHASAAPIRSTSTNHSDEPLQAHPSANS